MPHDAQAVRTLGLVAGQAGGRIEHGVQVLALRQVAVFGGDAAGNLLKLVAAGQIVVEHDEVLLEFGWDLHDRRQDDDERAVGLAGADLLGQGLDDLRRIQEAMEVGQHENRRAILRRQGVDRADGGQRIAAAGIGGVVLAGNLQAGGDVPDGQPPVLVAAELGNLGQGIVMLVGLNPEAGETGGNVFGQTLSECHGGYFRLR